MFYDSYSLAISKQNSSSLPLSCVLQLEWIKVKRRETILCNDHDKKGVNNSLKNISVDQNEIIHEM